MFLVKERNFFDTESIETPVKSIYISQAIDLDSIARIHLLPFAEIEISDSYVTLPWT